MRNEFFSPESTGFVSDEIALKQSYRQTSVHSNYFTANMNYAERVAQTQKLLDNAIVSAWHTVKTNRRPPKLTCTRWVWQMAGAYHSSCHTSRLMEEAAQRFAASGRQILAQWAAQKAKEEAGHDQLALLDIQSMGYKAEAVVQVMFPNAIKSWLDYFIQSVQVSDPINCIGHSYTSERLGTFQREDYIQSIDALFPPGIYATRWLRVHSGIGAEVKHIEDTVKIVTELTLSERISVARACYESAILRFMPPKENYISDEELLKVLKPLELNACLGV
ncbi:hypothetical protein [Nostoc sp. FACHB-110]|uniref:hypothetical protein n=1 Tax=Nostoc sp. FACHB-110 TaxID=2692834 RepID=UPI001685F7A0|nr:hypothetical protein [Nostoc sp. FACHB-110]MBD2435916.1 hypothetical protein [Nostoc sp. FACHB-110]